jgi:hypothetical protein
MLSKGHFVAMLATKARKSTSKKLCLENYAILSLQIVTSDTHLG